MADNSKPILPLTWNRSIIGPYGDLEAWDNYLLDEDIVKILGMIYYPTPDFRFAQEIDGNPYLKFYFTPPFCFHARELGYAPMENSDDDKEAYVE